MERDTSIAFLTASERSGSNLLTKIVDAHPQFCGPAPPHMIRTFSRNLFRYGDLQQEPQWRALTDDVAALLRAQLGSWRIRWTGNRIRKAVADRNLAAIVRQLYAEEAAANGKQRIVIKENHVHTFLAFLLAWFPDSRFLYVVRDPRDVALSWKLSPNHPAGVSRAAKVWRDDQAGNIEMLGYLADTGRIHVVRYEHLVLDSEAVVRGVCAFLRCQYSPDMLHFHDNELTVRNAGRLRDWANLRKPIMSDNFRKYRTQLSEAEIRYVEACCQQEMSVLGYAPEYPDSLDREPALERAVLDLERNADLAQETDLPEPERQIRRQRLAVIRRILRRDFYHGSERDPGCAP